VDDARVVARFADRAAAGTELGELIVARGVGPDPVVLALPRGGVPVALPVADILDADLDVLVVRKLRTPGQDELAFGAVASGGVRWLAPFADRLGDEVVERLTARERSAVEERERRYRPGRPPLVLTGRAVVLVDDGIATGSTVQAAVESARLLGAAQIVVGTPIAPPDAVARLDSVADRVDAVEVRRAFGAVSVLYGDFAQVPDDAVCELLQRRRAR
jgi:putative phosphoribosyl transferase